MYFGDKYDIIAENALKPFTVNKMNIKNELLRTLPKVDEALSLFENDQRPVPAVLIKRSVQQVIARERERLLSADLSLEQSPVQNITLDEWKRLFDDEIERRLAPNLKRVINGTGVVVHTNLGRSLLPEAAVSALTRAGIRYSNLEFDLASGRRGSRYSLVEEIICEITGGEAALVVNNNAAAVLLALDTLAHGREVIVSRGQLVEIGGSFRIPEVMKKSGAALVEVGATNRTHQFDYENAISEDTALLLRVHTSNFRMIGFTSEVSAADLVNLGKKYHLPVMEDLGSGSLIDLSPFGLPKEPTVQELVKAGVDIITFSGDKLLGGPQAGIIVGKQQYIEQIKKNQLNRALRIDKFTLAALEMVLKEYYDANNALKNIPTLAMLTEKGSIIKKRGKKLLGQVKGKIGRYCRCGLVKTRSRVGGGAMPEHGLDSWALNLSPKNIKLSRLESGMRSLPIPVIGRIEDEKYLLDLRTIRDEEIDDAAEMLVRFFASE